MIVRVSARPDRVERRGGLVENHEIGVPEQRDAKAETLLHPLGEGLNPGVAVVAEADRRQRPRDLRGPFGASEPGEPAVEAEHLGAAEPALVAEELGQIPHPLRVWRSPAGRPSTHASPPVGPAEAEEQLHRCGLAAAVRSEESEDLSTRHHHGEARERHGRPVMLGELEGPHRRPVRGRRRRRGGGGHQRVERATPSTWVEVSVPAIAYTTPLCCQITALPSPVESPISSPRAPLMVTAEPLARLTGMGTGMVWVGSPIAWISDATPAGMPGTESR